MDQRELIQQQIRDFDVQISLLQDEIAAIENGAITDTVAYEQKRSSLAEIVSKREAKILELNGSAETAQVELYDLFESLVIPGTDRIIPISYLLMTDDITLDDKITILTSNLEQKLVNAAIVQKSLEGENESLKGRNEELESENARLVRENDRIGMLNADLQVKHENAGEQIREKDAEIKRMNEETAKLREQLTNTATATKTHFTAEQTESIAEKLAKRPAVYNVRWADDLKRTHYIVTLAETGTDKTISRLELGLYREVSAEEADRFRAERAAKEAEEARLSAIVPDTPLVAYEVPPSLTPYEGKVDGMAEGHTSLEMAGEHPTRKEFEALAARVAQLEQSKVTAA